MVNMTTWIHIDTFHSPVLNYEYDEETNGKYTFIFVWKSLSMNIHHTYLAYYQELYGRQIYAKRAS